MAEMQSADVVGLVDELIRRAVAARASDVHFEPGEERMRVRFRIDALLQDVDALPAALAPNVVARLKVLSGLLTYRADVPQEGSIAAAADRFPCDIRVATFPTVWGERVVLRLLAESDRVRALSELGLDPELIERLMRLLALPQGLIVVCGPAGSGKTTTLYAMLRHILAERPGSSVLAVEDPVEIRLAGVTQVEIEPDRGLTYPVALRSLLRQDPQVLMIGEVRDAETARLVVEAALTGHLLLTTLHSGSPAEAVVRLREMGLPPYQITSTLQAVLAQRLVRRVCDDCGGDAAVGGVARARPDCRKCLGSGYAGRAAIGQLVEISPALRQAILDEADVAALARSDACRGSLRDDAARWLATGRTTEEEVRRVLGS